MDGAQPLGMCVTEIPFPCYHVLTGQRGSLHTVLGAPESPGGKPVKGWFPGPSEPGLLCLESAGNLCFQPSSKAGVKVWGHSERRKLGTLGAGLRTQTGVEFSSTHQELWDLGQVATPL